MNVDINHVLLSTIDYFKRNPFVAIAAGILFSILLFIIVSVFSPVTNNNKENLTTPTKIPFPSSTPQLTKPDTQPTISTVQQPAEDYEKNWEYSPFSESDFAGTTYTKVFLSNGNIQYTFPSEKNNRPNIMIVKNNVLIMQRTLMFQLTLDDVVVNFGKPDYTADGSHFWGKDAVMYIYFERGMAYTANKNTKEVFEQIEFMPVPPTEFKKDYGEDLIGDLKKY